MSIQIEVEFSPFSDRNFKRRNIQPNIPKWNSLEGRKKARILSKPDKDRSVHSKLKSIIGGFWRVSSCSIASPRDVSGKSGAADYIFKTPFYQL